MTIPYGKSLMKRLLTAGVLFALSGTGVLFAIAFYPNLIIDFIERHFTLDAQITDIFKAVIVNSFYMVGVLALISSMFSIALTSASLRNRIQHFFFMHSNVSAPIISRRGSTVTLAILTGFIIGQVFLKSVPFGYIYQPILSFFTFINAFVLSSLLISAMREKIHSKYINTNDQSDSTLSLRGLKRLFMLFTVVFLATGNLLFSRSIHPILDFVNLIAISTLSTLYGIWMVEKGIAFLDKVGIRIRLNIKDALLDRDHCQNKLPHYFISWIALSSFSGLILTLLFIFQQTLSIEYLYMEDNFFEFSTAIIFLFSAILLGKAAISTIKIDSSRVVSGRIYIALSYMMICLVLFFFAMEEISWGQRILGWGTPSWLELVNYQNETNVHNLFNPFLGKLMMFFTSIVFLISVFPACFTFPPHQRDFIHYVFPPPSLVILIGLVWFSAIFSFHELTEELLSLFSLFYAIKIVMITRKGLPENNVKV